MDWVATAMQFVGFFFGGFIARAGRARGATPRMRAVIEAARIGFLGGLMSFAYVAQHAAHIAVHQVTTYLTFITCSITYLTVSIALLDGHSSSSFSFSRVFFSGPLQKDLQVPKQTQSLFLPCVCVLQDSIVSSVLYLVAVLGAGVLLWWLGWLVLKDTLPMPSLDNGLIAYYEKGRCEGVKTNS